MTDNDFTKDDELALEQDDITENQPAADETAPEAALAEPDVNEERARKPEFSESDAVAVEKSDFPEAESKTTDSEENETDVPDEAEASTEKKTAARKYDSLVSYVKRSKGSSEDMSFSDQSKSKNKGTAVSAVEEAVNSVDEEFNLKGNITDKIYFAVLLVVTLFDFFAANLFMRKQAYFVSDKILEALGFDSLKFTAVSYSQICMALAYFVSLVAGGIVLLILLKILTKLFTHFDAVPKSKYIPMAIIGIFAVIFLIGFIVAYSKNDGFLTEAVYKWGCPAMAYVGGSVFYLATKFHVGIEY